METGDIRRVLLVGFMGSGKTEVGRILARLLAWRFRDLDEEVSARARLPVPEIFRRWGEAAFREWEAQVGEQLLREEEVVLATGGGWAAVPGRLAALPPGTLSVWLRVSAEEAVRRALSDGPVRPLLQGGDALEKARALLREREPFYRHAAVALDADQSEPLELARHVEHLLRRRSEGFTPLSAGEPSIHE